MPAELHDLVARKNVAAAKGLLKTLVPRAEAFRFYDHTGYCAWQSDNSDDPEVDEYVAEISQTRFGTAIDDELLRRTLRSGRTVLSLPVPSEQEPGLLVTVFSKNAGKSSSFNPDMLQTILQPAIDVIAENLRLHRQVMLARMEAEHAANELRIVYRVDEKIHGTSRSHSGLAQLVGQSGRFLEIAYSVLLIPSKRIRISATHSSWKAVNAKSLDKYLLKKLFPRLEGRRKPAVFDVAPVEGSSNPADQGYQAMLCPLADKAGNLDGVIAQLCKIEGGEFSKQDARFMQHVVRKAEYVIEQSFDSMTGLMNRTGFEAQLLESAKSLVDTNDTHQVVFMDLDNLQLVNDSFGRHAGDEVIVRFAQLIEEFLPQHGAATRLTEDDFAVILTQCNSDDAYDFAEKIRQSGDRLRYLQGDKSLQVTFSAGIAQFDTSAKDAVDVLMAARIACDSAKDHGRDRIEIHDSSNQSIIRRYDEMHLVAHVQRCLDADSFDLVAQPIVSLHGQPGGDRYEVLLRMTADDGQPIPSSTFISAAERYQIMPQIDRWVVSSTLKKLGRHREALASSGALFSINLSGQSLGDDEILNFIEEELDVSGVPARCICFEVTESAAVSNRRKAQSFIDALRKRGCRFSLDDFGAGLSSFTYLKNFHVDTLKIDGGFVRDITENQISESMVAAVTQVAKVMGLETVAEFVETEGARQLVAKLGVHYAQGHAIGKPLPIDSVIGTIEKARLRA